jgi:hypothetical protein
MKKVTIELDLTDAIQILAFFAAALDLLKKDTADSILRRNVLARVNQQTMKQIVKQTTTEELKDAMLINDAHFKIG